MVLRPTGIEINNVATDFSDGTQLVAFLEQLSGTKCPTKLVPPKNEIFKLQNLNAAMEMAKKMLKNICVNGRNFISGKELDVKYILGFIFDLVLHYQVDDIDVDGCRGQNGLLMWAQKTVAGKCKIDNFSLSWRDGLAFFALASAYSPQVDFQQEKNLWEKEQLQNRQEQLVGYRARIGRAVGLIQKLMGVEQILDEEFAEFPNDKANITYVSLIFRAFSQSKAQGKSQDIFGDLIRNAKLQQKMQQDILGKVEEFELCVECGLQQVQESKQQMNVLEQLPLLQKQARETLNQLQFYYNQIDNMLYKTIQHQQSVGQKTLFALPAGKTLPELQKAKQGLQKQFDDEVKRLMDLMKDFSKKYLADLMNQLTEVKNQFQQQTDGVQKQFAALKTNNDEESIRKTIQAVTQIQQSQVENLSALVAKAQNVQLTVNQQRQRMGLDRIDEVTALAGKQKQAEDNVNQVIESLNRQLENAGKKRLHDAELALGQLQQQLAKIADQNEQEMKQLKPEKKENSVLKEMLDKLQTNNRNLLNQYAETLAEYQAQEMAVNDIRNQLMVDRQENTAQLQTRGQQINAMYNDTENALRKAIQDTNEVQLKLLQDKAKKSFDVFTQSVQKTEKYVKDVDLKAQKSEKQLNDIILSLQDFEKFSIDQVTKQLNQYQNDQLNLNQHLVTMAKEKVDKLPELNKQFQELKSLMSKCIQACQEAQKRFFTDKLADADEKFQKRLNQFYQVVGEEKQSVEQNQFCQIEEIEKLKQIQIQLQQSLAKAVQRLQQQIQQITADQTELNIFRVQLLQSKINKVPELQDAVKQLQTLYSETDQKIEERITNISNAKMTQLQCVAENAKLEFEKFCNNVLDQFGSVQPEESDTLAQLEVKKDQFDQVMQLLNKEVQILINTYVKEQTASNRYRVQFSQQAIDHHAIMQKTRDELVAFCQTVEQQLTDAFTRENQKMLQNLESQLTIKEDGLVERIKLLTQQIEASNPSTKDFQSLKSAHQTISELGRNCNQQIAKLMNEYQVQLLQVNNQRHKMILNKQETPQIFQQLQQQQQTKYNETIAAIQKDLDKLNGAKLEEFVQKVDQAKQNFIKTCEAAEQFVKSFQMPENIDRVAFKQQELTEKQKQTTEQTSQLLSQFLSDQLQMNQQRLFMGHKKVDYTQQLENKREQIQQSFQQKLNEIKQFQISEFKSQLSLIEKTNLEKTKQIKLKFDEFSLKLNQVDTLMNYKLIQSVIEEWLELNSQFSNQIQLEINEIESNNLRIDQLSQKFNFQKEKKTIQDFSFLLLEANEKVQNLIKELKQKYEEGLLREQELQNQELRQKFNQFCVKDPSKNAILKGELEQLLFSMDLSATQEQLESCFKESVGFQQVLALINKLDNNQENIQKCLQATEQLKTNSRIGEEELKKAGLEEELEWIKENVERKNGEFDFEGFITKFYQ